MPATLALLGFDQTFTVDLQNDPNIKNFENVQGSYYFGDTLLGTDKANRIDSGGGSDSMTGRGGADVFIFSGGSDAFGFANGFVSEITDFSQKQKDLIDLSGLMDGDGPARFVGTKGFSGEGAEVRYVNDKSETLALVDINGDTLTDFALRLDEGVKLTQDDLIL